MILTRVDQEFAGAAGSRDWFSEKNMGVTLPRQVQAAREATRKRIKNERDVSAEVRKLLRCIADRLFDPKFGATVLRRQLKPSKAAEREFKEKLGFTIGRYIKEQRMLTRKQLFETTTFGVSEIVPLVPGVSENHVSTNFRDWDKEHRRPSEVRQACDPEGLDLDGYRRLWIGMQLRLLDPDQSRQMRAMTNQLAKTNRGDRLQEAVIGHSVDALNKALGQFGLDTLEAWCRSRYCTKVYCRAFFDRLSERSRIEGRKSRERGLELAELALALVEGNAERLGEAESEMLALAWARLGNARRLASDFDGSEQALREADRHAHDLTDALSVKAETLCYWGSLRFFQRRCNEAEQILQEAIIDSRAAGVTWLEVGALQQRAAVRVFKGDANAAAQDLQEALRMTPQSDARATLGSFQLLMMVYIVLEEFDDLRALLPEARLLGENMDDRPTLLQIRWAEGLLMREQQQFEEAETLLKETQSGFDALGDRFMTAIVALDLALLFETQGRTLDVLEHASRALPALEALNLPESFKARRLLQQAMKHRNVETTLLKRTRHRLLCPAAA